MIFDHLQLGARLQVAFQPTERTNEQTELKKGKEQHKKRIMERSVSKKGGDEAEQVGKKAKIREASQGNRKLRCMGSMHGVLCMHLCECIYCMSCTSLCLQCACRVQNRNIQNYSFTHCFPPVLPSNPHLLWIVRIPSQWQAVGLPDLDPCPSGVFGGLCTCVTA